MKESHKYSYCCHSLTSLLFNQLPILEHLLFQLLTTSGKSSYYINWHIFGFRWFRCCHGIITNRFNFEHVLYFNFFGAFSKSMFYAITNHIGITNNYCFLFNRLGFCSCYRFYRCNYSSWHNWYLFFPVMIGFH
jgi:hypothetical protein